MSDQRWRVAGIQMKRCLIFEYMCVCVLLSLSLYHNIDVLCTVCTCT